MSSTARHTAIPIPRLIGPGTAVLAVVANMIGAGVFTTTGFLVRDIGSPSAILLAWGLGGLIALCGALSYAELVADISENGGEYRLLSRIYHPALGVCAGLVSLVAGFSAPIAASALAFGSYLHAIWAPASPALAGMVLIVIVSTLHALDVRAGGGVQNLFTVAKVLLIALFIGGGLLASDLGRLSAPTIAPLGESLLSPPFAVGLIFIAFAYSGWNAAAYLAGEVRNPTTNLPLALIAGTCLVAALYVGLNAVFLSSAPAAELAGKVEVGHVAATHLFGGRAGGLLSALIACALVSSVSAMTMVGSRVYEAMGTDFRALAGLRRESRFGGPARAIALQSTLAIVMVLGASFESLLTYIGFLLSLSAALTVAGVIVLRRREPERSRPYRAFGYPWTPIVFILFSAWMICHALAARPVQALAGLATIACGLGLYRGLRRSASDPR